MKPCATLWRNRYFCKEFAGWQIIICKSLNSNIPMPLNLPDRLPAIELLKEENIFVIDNSRATQQDIRPLRIGF